MVTSVTNLSRNGLSDWLIQRVTAFLIGAYLIFLFFFMILHRPLSYLEWYSLFAQTWMEIFSFLVLLSIVAHAWVGLWTVLTDYVKLIWLRLFLEIVIAIYLIALLVWGVLILWG